MTNRLGGFRFTVNPETAASIHDDGIVIFHTASGSLYSSNGSGARIWRGIEQQLPLEAIAGEISAEFQIADSSAREHVARFVAALERNELIQRKGEVQ